MVDPEWSVCADEVVEDVVDQTQKRVVDEVDGRIWKGGVDVVCDFNESGREVGCNKVLDLRAD